ncbi:ArsB/NhaD family transporter [Paenibacillus contaminans]|uniref:ArsB/NhaD family transporter n=1 Tax=Paenibacillus contaminans TaxID=450362 RepID=UPI001863C430|nr:ArsB/NhaD family transporter [Paenibacillus contaminans]
MEIASQAATWQVVSAAVIFLVSYAVIITDKINRAIIALAGALLLILLGIADMKMAYSHYIEWQTIFLLVGMMLLVGIVNKSGIFQYIAIKSAQIAKGEPIRILLMLSLVTAVGSAFMDNVTTVLLMVPVTFTITRVLKLNPIPYLISEILAANIGGTATLIGSPPNMMIGTATHLDFNDFLLNLAPVAVVILAVTLLFLRLWYGAQLRIADKQKAELMTIDAGGCIKNKALAIKSLIVLGLTLLGFLLHSAIQVEAAVVAIAGATLLMLISVKDIKAEDVFHSVEWVTVLFFAGLFVLVGGLTETGIIGKITTSLLEMTEANIPFIAMIVLWVSGIASATVDNIPFVASMIPMIKDIGVQLGVQDEALDPIWWSLALGASLGGNGTLIGASANMIAAGMAGKEGKPLSFAAFLKIGLPVTLISLAISTIYVSFILM